MPEFPQVKHPSVSSRLLTSTLSFKQDPLGEALEAFTRLLSIPPKPESLAALRRELLRHGVSSRPASGREKARINAEALSAVLAADKGVSLSKEALEDYAAALDPFAFPEREGKDGEKPRKKPEDSLPAPPDAEALSKLAGNSGEQDQTLRILNQLPGKDGKRWLTLPFELSIEGTQYRVSMSVLLREPSSKTGTDILTLSLWAGEKRRFFRMLRSGAGSPGETVCALEVFPEMPAKGIRALEGELRRRFAGLAETVTVKNGGEWPPRGANPKGAGWFV